MPIGLRSTAVRIVIAGVALWAVAAPRLASADWPQSGRAISTAVNAQQHSAIATDGADGAIITWQDLRSSKINIFAQHVRATGEVDAAWPANGAALLTDPLAMATADGGQTSPVIVSDGAGGAIVAWQDLRSAATETDIFAQHVLASGEVDPNWESNGTALCSIEGIQNTLTIASDGAGGAIVTWRDGRPGASSTDIYAQHVLASGQVDLRWPENGLAVCTATGSQEFPTIVGDGAGGSIITWHDLRRDPNNFDIFAQHVLGSGVVDRTWPADGLAVSLADGNQGFPTIASDGAHGAIIAWTDGRSGTADHIFAQHVLGSGQVDPAWPVDGRAISDASDQETRPLIVSDGAGGAIVTWQSFSLQLTMYAQHVTAGGIVDPAWPRAGKPLSTSDRQQTTAQITSDGAGGAIVVWRENADIFAQRVLASGSLDPTYPAAGRPVVNLPSGQGDPALVATAGGGAIVAWSDTRGGLGLDIYAMQVLAVDTVTAVDGPPEVSRIRFARPKPNPARGPFALSFALPREAKVMVIIYDAAGRRVRELASGALPSGEHSLTWDLRDQGGQVVGAGVYFARLEAEGDSFTKKLVMLR
jgi:flagellar hook capping protein FlgD